MDFRGDARIVFLQTAFCGGGRGFLRFETTDEMNRRKLSAGWQSGYAAACKAAYAGSIPTPASVFVAPARMVEWVDTGDLKSPALRRAGSNPAPGKRSRGARVFRNPPRRGTQNAAACANSVLCTSAGRFRNGG